MQYARPFKKAWTANANTSSFASKVPTLTEPVNDGVVNLLGGMGGGVVPERLLILPYGLGSDNDVFDMRLIGWRHIGSGISPGTLWVPTIMGVFTCTISAAVGVAAAPVLDTERFADTIILKTTTNTSQPTYFGADSVAAMSFGDIRIFSPTGDLIGWIEMPLRGFEKIEFAFDQTTGTPTMNCLIASL